VANVVDDRFKTMQLNISGVKAFSAHPTSISRYLVADLGYFPLIKYTVLSDYNGNLQIEGLIINWHISLYLMCFPYDLCRELLSKRLL
jgi:hypothetical protein